MYVYQSREVGRGERSDWGGAKGKRDRGIKLREGGKGGEEGREGGGERERERERERGKEGERGSRRSSMYNVVTIPVRLVKDAVPLSKDLEQSATSLRSIQYVLYKHGELCTCTCTCMYPVLLHVHMYNNVQCTFVSLTYMYVCIRGGRGEREIEREGWEWGVGDLLIKDVQCTTCMCTLVHF